MTDIFWSPEERTKINKILWHVRKEESKIRRLYFAGKYNIKEIADLLHLSECHVEDKVKSYELKLKNIKPRKVNKPYKHSENWKDRLNPFSTVINRREQGEYIIVKTNNGWKLEHRFVWETLHGKLPKGWVVHHINGIKTDNRPENLLGMPRGEHCPEATSLMIGIKSRIHMRANEIKRLRKDLGLSQQKFAEKIGVGIATVSRWEKSLTKPSPLAAAKLETINKRTSMGQESSYQAIKSKNRGQIAEEIMQNQKFNKTGISKIPNNKPILN